MGSMPSAKHMPHFVSGNILNDVCFFCIQMDDGGEPSLMARSYICLVFYRVQ